MNIEQMCLRNSSGAYTTDFFPDDWSEYSEEARFEWLEDHCWEPMEGTPPEEYLGIIEDHATCTERVILEVLEKVKQGLIEAAIETKLPLDFRELDMLALAELSKE